MKKAISIPDALFAEGERLAKRLKLNRSELYARALAEILRRHDPAEITNRLNAAYGGDAASAGLDPVIAAHVRRNLKKVEW